MTKHAREKFFVLDGRKHYYCPTRKNERCVEVSLGVDFLQNKHQGVLEVGNVMRTHQRKMKHLVVDLHEKRRGWRNYINADVLKWKPSGPLRQVLSISTVEHTVDPITAIKRMLTWAPRVLITLPLGYSSQSIKTNEVCLEDYGNVEVSFMSRGHAGEENWRQIDRKVVEAGDFHTFRWGTTYPQASAAICIIRKGPA